MDGAPDDEGEALCAQSDEPSPLGESRAEIRRARAEIRRRFVRDLERGDRAGGAVEQALARVSVREEHAREVCEVHRTGPGHSKRAQIDAPWSVLPGRPRRRAASPVCADDVRQSIVKETHVRHRHVGRRGRNLRSASWRVGLDA